MIGPVLGLVGSETEDLQHFAEYGVVLMLFLIGLEMQPQTLWDMRIRLLGLGGLQVGLTLAAITLVGDGGGPAVEPGARGRDHPVPVLDGHRDADPAARRSWRAATAGARPSRCCCSRTSR